ncbi:hypothetical protein EVAR_103472_1 [Eumeta japonica]|uniref:Uncharacterized protein n=1 Tax=Eumeta variegata TaxID=151549 RepID=A0A4C1YXC7_EUMVA|nr:hypothetical protein EVAR_103472_1 [Eumeta japonica]
MVTLVPLLTTNGRCHNNAGASARRRLRGCGRSFIPYTDFPNGNEQATALSEPRTVGEERFSSDNLKGIKKCGSGHRSRTAWDGPPPGRLRPGQGRRPPWVTGDGPRSYAVEM